MKVVINRCFGGFGLSAEAFEEFLRRKGVEFDIVETDRSFGFSGKDYYYKGFAGVDEKMICEYDLYENRADPALVSVVEDMGEKANGWAAELKVVDVPDGVEWDVHENDGLEWVAEKHRIWV